MPYVKANGCKFYYELDGAGPDIVFIHGEIHGLDYWEHQVSDFAADHRCFAYNRRGHAGTEWSDYGFSLVNQTRDLGCLIDALKIEHPVIIAVAFGTTIAANYAIENPGRVRGLVLGAWSELHDSLQYFQRWARYSEEAALVLENEGRDGLVAYLRKHGGRTIYKVIPIDSPVRDRVITLFASHPLQEYRRGMLEFGLSVPDLVPRFRALDVPVLGICGDRDPYPDRPEVLAGMPNFREAAPIAGGSRFAHWEKPKEFNAAVRSFIRSLDDGTALQMQP